MSPKDVSSVMRLEGCVLMSLLATVSGCAAQQCAPADAIVAKLSAYFAYQNRDANQRISKTERFTVLRMGEKTFLRHLNPVDNYDPNLRPVIVFQGAEMMEGLNCPADGSWLNCVAEWALDPRKDEGKISFSNEPPRFSTPAPREPTCQFSLQVPQWKPSPDDAVKRRVAAELLRELREHGWETAKEIYVRDFNLNDPDIMAYIVDGSGTANFRGCEFSVARTPLCQWHGFGQSPPEALRQEVMAQPYRLYPPPLGRR